MQRSSKDVSTFESVSMIKIYELVIQKIFDFKDSKVKQQHATIATYQQLWKVFTRWSEGQLEINRSVNLGRFGIANYKFLSEGKFDRTIQVSFVISFLMFYNLTQDDENIQDFGSPVVKINYQWIAKSINIDKNEIIQMLNYLFDELQDHLIMRKLQEIDLDVFGVIRTDLSGRLTVTPAKKKTHMKLLNMGRLFDNHSHQLQQVKNIVNQPILIPAPTCHTLAGSQVDGVTLPMLNFASQPSVVRSPYDVDTSVYVHDQHTQPFYIRGAQHALSAQQQTVPISFRSNQSVDYGKMVSNQSVDHGRLVNKIQLFNNFRKVETQHPRSNSPTRRVLNPQHTKIPSQLMCVGQDPLSRDHTFSLMASNGQDLFQSVFSSSTHSNPDYVRLPPVCDQFSRTLAAPHNGVSRNLCGNIGSNYSLQVKRLQMDPKTMQLVFLAEQRDQNRFQQRRRVSNLVASEQEELLFAMYGMKVRELQQRVLEKAKQYEKYVQYVNEGIGNDQVAPLKVCWIRHICEYIKEGSYYSLKGDYIKAQIEVMLQEVVNLYFFYVKSSILDYLLLDPWEQQRLGLAQIQTRGQWGSQGVVKYRLVTQQQRLKLKQNKTHLSITLLCYQQSTLQILRVWYSKFINSSLVVLASGRVQPLPIREFCQLQYNMIEQGRCALNTQWIQSVKRIYELYLHQMGQVLGQLGDFAQRFHRNHAALLNILLRAYITSNVAQYRIYLDKWRDSYFQPLITVSVQELIQHSEAHAEFEESAHAMRDLLMKVIEDIIVASHHLVRPECGDGPDPQYLQKLYVNETLFSEMYSQTNYIIEVNIEKALQVLPIYEKYTFLFKEIDKVIMNINGRPLQDQAIVMFDGMQALQQSKVLVFTHDTLMTRSRIKQEISTYQSIWVQVMTNIPFEVQTNLVLVQGTSIKKKMLTICNTLVEMYVEAVYEYILRKNTTIQLECLKLLEVISMDVVDTTQLIELESIVERVLNVDFQRLQREFKELVTWIMFIYDYQVRISVDHLHQFNTTSNILKSMLQKVNLEHSRIRIEREHLESNLSDKQETFVASFRTFHQMIEGLKNFTTVYMQKDANDYVDKLVTYKQDLQREVQSINEEEQLLGMEVSHYPVLDDSRQVLQRFEDMWRLIRRYQQNMDAWKREQYVFKLDPCAIEVESESMLQAAQQLFTLFKQQEDDHQHRDTTKRKHFEPVTVITDLLESILEFNKHIPIIRCLCTEGLKERHWDRISILFGFPISPDKEIYLKRLIELEMVGKLDELLEITNIASLVYQFEKRFLLIVDHWRVVHLDLLDHDLVVGTHQQTIFNVQQLQQQSLLMDDHLVDLHEMASDPYATTFLTKIAYQEQWMHYTQQLIPQLIANQTIYLRIAPLFLQTDAARQMPEGQQRWKDISTRWTQVTKIASQYTKIVDFTKQVDLPMMEQNLKTCGLLLHTLRVYLDHKRKAVPRFFLLTDQQLISLLSAHQQQDCILPHLSHLFKGVHQLILDDKLVVGLVASGGERLHLHNSIYINNFTGNPEGFISQLEEAIVESIRLAITNPQVKDAPSPSLLYLETKQKVLQLSLLNNDLYYTTKFEQAMQDRSSLISNMKIIAAQLSELLRQTLRPLSHNEIHDLSTLLVNESSWRDVVANLESLNVVSVQDFHWTQQIKCHLRQDHVQISVGDSLLPYGYEYVNNIECTVMTALTLRAFYHLARASAQSTGCLIIGETAGRSSTFKDLARRCGRQQIDLTGSQDDDWDHTLSRLAKAVASNHLWLCTDDSLNVEQMSKVASFVSQIYEALQTDEERLNLFGQDVQLKRGFGLCMVIKPHNIRYLPDHVKHDFRRVALLVPPLELIVPTQLFGLGFIEYNSLATIVIKLFSQCPDQYPLHLLRSITLKIIQIKADYHYNSESNGEWDDLSYIGQELHILKNAFQQVISGIYEGEQLELISESIQIALTHPAEVQHDSYNKRIWFQQEL